MTRKDSEKEAERPHYYSQFWLDIAAGRRTIGGPKPEDEGELLDDAPEPISLRRPLRNEPDEDLDHEEVHVAPRAAARTRSVAPVVSIDEDEPEEEVTDVDNGEDLDQDEVVADADIPDMDFVADEEVAADEEDIEDENEDEEIFDEEEEDEEEEGWVPGRGRKKPSPKRPTKQPPVKRPKRDTRRSF